MSDPQLTTSSILAKFNTHLQPEKSRKGTISKAYFYSDNLDAGVSDIYRKIGSILCNYKSGKLPKALKVLPSLKSWDALLLLTAPETWTPNATYQITKIFVSALSPHHAEMYDIISNLS